MSYLNVSYGRAYDIVSGQYPTMIEKELCTYPLVGVLETKVMSPIPVSKT